VLAGRLVTSGGNPVPGAKIDIYDAANSLVHTISTYGPRVAHPDDAWQENFAISDLPAGGYYLVASITKSSTETDTVSGEVNVVAGQTNYIILQADAGVVGNDALDIVQPPAFLPTYTPSFTPTPTNTPTPTATRTPRPTPTATATWRRYPTFTP